MKLKLNNLTRRTSRAAIFALCLSLIQLNLALAGAQEPDAQRARLRTLYQKFNARETALKAEASRYDQAISALAAIERMPISSEAEIRNILNALSRSRRGTEGVFGKMVTIALNTSSLKAGAEAEADRLTPKGVALQLRQSPSFVGRIRGFDDAKRAIQRQLQSDIALHQRLSKKLESISRRRASITLPGGAESLHAVYSTASSPLTVRATYSPSAPAVEPLMQIGLEVIVVSAIGIIIAAYAARKAADFTEPEDPDNEEDTRSRFRVCMDKADAKLDTCLGRNRGNFFGEAGCWAVYLFEKGECLTLPL